MLPDSFSNLIIVAFLLGAQIILRPSVYGERRRTIFFRIARSVFWVLLAGNILVPFYLAYQQYRIWLTHPVSQLLLPPHQSIFYFFKYALNNFFLTSLLAVFLAVVCWLVVKFLNRIRQGKIFEPAEGYLLGSSIVLIGLSNVFWYLAGVLAVATLFSIFYFLFSRNRGKRLSLYYFWLPAAALVILSSKVIFLVAKP